MFVSFRETFAQGVQGAKRLPSFVVERLSEQLPGDARYYQLDDGTLCLGPSKGKTINVGGLAPTRDYQKRLSGILGRKPTIDDYLQLSYNEQKPIKLQLLNPGEVTINGSPTPLDKLVKGTTGKAFVEEDYFMLIPDPFPPPFHLQLTAEDERGELTLDIQRIPTESMSEAKYKSTGYEPFTLSYTIPINSKANRDPMGMGLQFTMNPAKCESLSEAVNIMRVFASLAAGTCRVGDFKPTTTAIEDADSNFNIGILHWFEMALQIERKLNLEIDPKSIILNAEAIKTLAELYQGLVLGEPIKEPQDSILVTFDADVDPQIEEMLQEHNDRMAFTCYGERKYTLFQNDVTLPIALGFFNMKASKTKSTKKGTKQVRLESAEEEPRGYTARIPFRDDAERDAYYDGEIMNRLQSAEQLTDIVRAYDAEERHP